MPDEWVKMGACQSGKNYAQRRGKVGWEVRLRAILRNVVKNEEE
jgi:hypothetical protein